MKIWILPLYSLLALSAIAAENPLSEARKAYSQKQYQKAFETLGPLCKNGPDGMEACMLLGTTAVRLGKWEEAASAFINASQWEPLSALPYIQLGFLYEKTREDQKAKDAWEKVLELSQNESTRKMAQKHLGNLK